MKIRLRLSTGCMGRLLPAVVLVAVLVLGGAGPAAATTQTDIVGPPNSGQFGFSVTVLANGNIVVADPYYDDGVRVDAGAVYLYDGATGTLISTLVGAKTDDRIGSGGVMALGNGNYLVLSPNWHYAGDADAGAVTWGDGKTGVSGVVSEANSLVGSTAGDQIGSWDVVALGRAYYLVLSPNWDNGGEVDAGAVTWGNGTTGTSGVVSAANSLVGGTAGDGVGWVVTVLSTGHYVVSSPDWDRSGAADVGAVTWGNGMTGVRGTVSVANSLVGSVAGDRVGSGGVIVLENSSYVVRSPNWDNGAVVDAGAVTWGNRLGGISGAVSAANSLVGSTASDKVGSSGVRALEKGGYVVSSPNWDRGGATNAGAATWGDQAGGTSGAVSAANSLVGSVADDLVGWTVTALSNGHYVVGSPWWDNGGMVDAGAVTWGNGATGTVGAVTAANSLVGGTAGDSVSSAGVWALSNGHYVVGSPWWNNGTVTDAGAATWGNRAGGTVGEVSAANSLVGSTTEDYVGSHVTALSNGHYVVSSTGWNDGAELSAGAATWCNGATGGTVGAVSAANSLVGSTANDRVGWKVAALSNGNYVVLSRDWDNGMAANAGAATWCNGTGGTVGAVSAANSLVGSTADDAVGSEGVMALANGNYLVHSDGWDNGGAADAGAVTWGDGATGGTVGAVSAANSLVGGTAGDQVGQYPVMVLANGNYVVCIPYWDNGGAADAGAVTWGSGATGVSGAVSAANSLVGGTAGDQVGGEMVSLSNGHYVVRSYSWDNGAVVDAGAVTWGDGRMGTSGPIAAENSVRGGVASGGGGMSFDYNRIHGQLVVGRPMENIVTLFKVIYPVFLPVSLKDGP